MAELPDVVQENSRRIEVLTVADLFYVGVG